MKMYILVRNDIPVGFAVNSVAHAAVSANIAWGETKDWWEWVQTSFRKVTCGINVHEFDEMKKIAVHHNMDFLIIKESDYNNEEMVLIFAPRNSWPSEFKNCELYKGELYE